MAFRLKRGEGVGEGVRRVAKEEMATVAQSLALPEDQRDTGIHEARKSLKKLRAILRLIEPVTGDPARLERNRLRDAARRISGFRDAAVAIETFDGLRERYGRPVTEKSAPDPGMERFRASLVRMKEKSEREGIAETLRIAAAAVAKVEARVETWHIPAEGHAAIGPGLEKTYRRGCKALKAARGQLASDLGHALRKRVKDLWYDLRLLEGTWLNAGRLRKELDKLEELLGEDHNLAMLTLKIPPARRGQQKREWQQRLEEWIAAHRMELCSKAERTGSRVYAAKPGAFVRSVLTGGAAKKRASRKAAA